jgi:phenylalanyl-tRNA synthetase beta chain
MRVNLDWLNDWTDVGDDVSRIEDDLTSLGLEVESSEVLIAPSADVVVAEVLSVEPHPNADRLSVCIVDDGVGQQQVVCGARNVATGIKAPFARVFATLPNGKKIGAAEFHSHAHLHAPEGREYRRHRARRVPGRHGRA